MYLYGNIFPLIFCLISLNILWFRSVMAYSAVNLSKLIWENWKMKLITDKKWNAHFFFFSVSTLRSVLAELSRSKWYSHPLLFVEDPILDFLNWMTIHWFSNRAAHWWQKALGQSSEPTSSFSRTTHTLLLRSISFTWLFLQRELYYAKICTQETWVFNKFE